MPGTAYRILRSILAVLVGALTGILLSVGTDAVLQHMGLLPPTGQPAGSNILLVATLYRTVYGVLGACFTARLAPSRPMLHAMILGALGLVANLAGLITTWDKGAEYGPHWYPIALTLLSLPTAWFGAKLVRRAG